MTQIRSVHGGPDSHLSVEVAAVRGWPDLQFDNCDAEPERATAIGIYIRNPLAFHVEDFEVPHPDELDGSIEDAFRRAEALAEHLGCPVVSRLKRPID